MSKPKSAVSDQASIDSPTLDGMEMQSKIALIDTQTTTSTTTTAVTNASIATTAVTNASIATTAVTNASIATTAIASVGPAKTSVHVTALDGIVNVNSLFTMATFIGFSMTVPEAATAVSEIRCHANRETVRMLIVYEVLSFSFFLCSSLIAQSIKLAINLLNNMDPTDPHKADIDPSLLKYGLFSSAIGSVLGCGFLMLSIVNFIQVKLGIFGCGGKPVYALATLLVFVGSGLVVYVTTAIYASFFVEVSSKVTSTTTTSTTTNQITQPKLN